MRRFIPFLPSPAVIPVLRLKGSIGGRGLTDEGLARLIDKAFAMKPAAVALVINSPGGSAVQSSLIAARIRRLADDKSIPVHAFVEDVAASGGYWLATAADDIWVDASSILGSIGVIFAGFGFADAIARHGIERRVVTSGRSKSLADPFQPEKPEDVARLKALQEPIHKAFIAQVQDRRGARLAREADLFNADVWTGAEAVSLGLADGIGHLVPTIRRLYGAKARLVPLGRKPGLAARLGLSLGQEALELIEERAAFARFGL